MTSGSLLIFGAGYCGRAIASAAAAQGFAVTATSRTPAAADPGFAVVPFDAAGPAIARATHLLMTAPPGESGDPALHAYRDAIATAPDLRWIGYLSTTGVYGDRGGAWVDETTPPAPGNPRSLRRLEAEHAWSSLGSHHGVDLFRIAGIYGPGRSALDDLRSGRARRVDQPGHAFGRIHRDDITGAVLAAIRTSPRQGTRILNLSDDEPAPSADVIAEAARLLGLPTPPLVPYELALATMSPMARSFWAENRRVAAVRTQQTLGYAWRHPTYRSGLAAILAKECRDRPA
jgi:nucleoside-diphosphate-sugar epimerase